MAKRRTNRLVINRETLRNLTDKALEGVNGGGNYANTLYCSTESMSKCANPKGGVCLQRK